MSKKIKLPDKPCLRCGIMLKQRDNEKPGKFRSKKYCPECAKQIFREANIKHRNEWSKDEDDIFRAYYPIYGSKIERFLPGRNRSAIRHRAMTLKLRLTPQAKYNAIYVNCAKKKSGNGRIWQPEEDDILREHYPQEGSLASERLVRRSQNAVRRRAYSLGVKANLRAIRKEAYRNERAKKLKSQNQEYIPSLEEIERWKERIRSARELQNDRRVDDRKSPNFGKNLREL